VIRRIALRTIVIGMCAAATAAVNGRQRPQFEARTDLVLVDVTVVDDRGRPVTDLRSEEFVVQVEGETRPLESVQFLSANAVSEPRPVDAGQAREAQTTSNTGPNSGRLLLIAVDESHLRLGANRAILRAAESVIERLARDDFVGLVRIPTGADGVEFTTNRERIRAALRAVSGRSAGGVQAAAVSLSDAADFVQGPRDRWAAVIQRECGSPPAMPAVGAGAGSGSGRGQTPEGSGAPSADRGSSPFAQLYDACVTTAESAARGLIADHETRTQTTLRFLDALFARLRPLDTPVNLILISEGMFISPQLRGEFARLAARAAGARISLHIVRPDRQLYDATSNLRAPDSDRDDSLLREGLEEMATSMRGGLFTVVGSGTTVFDRISSELSGYYLLGFEPTADDRTGRDRRIKVEVRRRGVTVRARASFAVPLPESPPPTSAERLQQALLSPLPNGALPMRVTTYRAISAGDGQVRVIIGAEIGEPTREAGTVPINVMVLDASGKVVVGHAGDAELQPARAATPSPWLYLTSVLLRPGEYTLRVAAAASDGRIGSIQHPFSARLQDTGAGLLVSDLLVTGAADNANQARPSPSAIIDGDRITLMLEAAHADADALAGVRVSFDISEAGRDRSLVTVAAAAATRGDATQRAFGGVVGLEALQTGEYLARARIESAGRPVAFVERPFRVERTNTVTRRTMPAADAGTPPVVRSAPPPPARFMMPTLRFSVEDVLRPEIVNPFLEYLQTNLRPSDAVRPVLEEARRGTYAQRAPGPGATPDEVVLAFVSGLAALKQGQLPQAQALFQRALRGAPDFLGLAFFLGATHAAAGRDRDAIGAWQMSLRRSEAAAAPRFLVDALLRAGEAKQALDVIERGPDAWKATREIQERVGIAEAVADQASALPRLEKLISERPDDPDLLIVGIQVLYRQHLREPLSGGALALFEQWTLRYQETAGSSRPSIAPWRNYVLGSR
jgi:VWFA-related protein